MPSLPVRVCALFCLALLMATSRPAFAAARAPIHVAPADDPVLSTLLLAGAGVRQPVLLFDPRDRDLLAHYIALHRTPAHCFHRRLTPPATVDLMRETTGEPCTVVGSLPALARTLWPTAASVIVVPAGDYPWLLRAAAFAGATGTALLPVTEDKPPALADLAAWKLDTIYLAGAATGWKAALAGTAAAVVDIDSPDKLTEELLRRIAPMQPTAVVITNPNDRNGMFSPSALSLLAPLVSTVHRAPLLLITETGPDVIEQRALTAIDAHRLHPTHIILVGDELGLRSHVLPDPVLAAGGPEARGGGTQLRVELFSEIQSERPQDFAVGRIVSEDAAIASLVLARQLHRGPPKPKPVTFLTNADEVFALGEAISRTTVAELRNLGASVRAYYRREITPEVIRRALKDTELLVWEGHSRDLTLEDPEGITAAGAPDVVILQGCYTLDRSDPLILMAKGTQAIVASSAAIYSAPGSAFARALFDALLYERADLGTAVRNARNYLLALAQLERARQHPDWRKTYRAALAFALWGDPTLRPPLPLRHPATPPVRWARLGDTLSLDFPGAVLPEVTVGRYRARIAPRMMLGGLVLEAPDSQTREIKDLLYAVTASPPAHIAACPPSPGWDVISLYAPRTETLSILARPDWSTLGARARRGHFAFPLAADPAACR